MKKVKKNKAWAMLWIATGINFMVGLLYAWSVIGKSLIKEYNWTNTQASLPYTVATVCFALSMAAFGKLYDRKGPKICVMLTAILLGLGLVISGFATSPVIMTVSFGVIAGAGIGISNISTTPPVLKWFSPNKKGMVTGIVVAGVALSAIFFAPLFNFLIPVMGISKVFIIVGAGIFVVIMILAQFIENPPQDYIAEQYDSTQEKNIRNILPVSIKNLTTKEMIKEPSFYLLWLMFALSSSAGLMVIGHAATIAKVQVNWDGGFMLVIFLSIFNAAGRFLGGVVSDRIGRINLMRIIFVLQALNMLLFSNYLTILSLAFGVSLGGLCYGASFSVFPATTADFYGLRNFGANYGVVFTAWGFGGIVGPMMAAKIEDATQSYNVSYIIAFALLSIATVITLFFKKISTNTEIT